jgi:hypothetical protein
MDTITVGTEERAKFEGAYDHISTLTDCDWERL